VLGLKKGIVELFSHDEQWHRLFTEEKARLEDAVGEHILTIEHIGSTSICGISAKPIIDIAIGIENYSMGDKCVELLKNLGYEYRGEYGIAGRHYFVKGESRRTHHLHMVELKSDFWRSHLLFRDYLQQNQAAALEYEKLKKDLAQKNFENRDAYLHGKKDFVEGILKAAGFKSRETT
jgi:GrpB-like predicted nucleotidyltransferase (UPF0157 family)